MRFIATADWQLGMTAHYLDDEARPRFQQARFDAVRRIGELAAARDAAFVVVGGDVFETNQLHRSVVARTFEVLRRCPVPVVLVPGNHDPLDAASIYDSEAFQLRTPPHVHVVRDATPFEVVPGAEVVGVPWRSKHPTTDLVAEAMRPLTPVEAGTVRVVVGHGAVQSLDPDATSLATIDDGTLRRQLDEGLAHVVVLGDRHSTTEVSPRIWYPGAPEVTARRELDPGNVLVIDVTPDEVRVEPVHVGRWSFVTVEQRLDHADDVQALRSRLDAMPDKDRTAVWLPLQGTLRTSERALLDEVLEEYAELFARLDHWQRHTDLAVVPDEHDFADLGLAGFVEDARQELVAMTERADADALVAQDALGLLHRFAGAAR